MSEVCSSEQTFAQLRTEFNIAVVLAVVHGLLGLSGSERAVEPLNLSAELPFTSDNRTGCKFLNERLTTTTTNSGSRHDAVLISVELGCLCQYCLFCNSLISAHIVPA